MSVLLPFQAGILELPVMLFGRQVSVEVGEIKGSKWLKHEMITPRIEGELLKIDIDPLQASKIILIRVHPGKQTVLVRRSKTC